MDKTTMIGLTGHANQYRLEEDAYDRLVRYLERAALRLRDDPDRGEVLGDLERSIGDGLAVLVGSGDRLIIAADIDDVIDEIGAVDTGHDSGHDAGNDEAGTHPRARRMRRIREGQEIAGVCNGLAAYSELDVDWVRTLFVLGTLITSGILGLIYIALAFILPVAATREAY